MIPLGWVAFLLLLVFFAGRLSVRRNNRWNEGSFLRAALQEQREMVSKDVQALIDRGDAALKRLPDQVATATSAAVTTAINNRDTDRSDDMAAFGGFVGRVEAGVNSIGQGGSSSNPGDSTTGGQGADTTNGGQSGDDTIPAGGSAVGGEGDTLLGGEGDTLLAGDA